MSLFLEIRNGCFVNLDLVVKIEARDFDITLVTNRDTEFISGFKDAADREAYTTALKAMLGERLGLIGRGHVG